MELGVATEQEIKSKDFNISSRFIPEGRCAVLRLIGSSDNLRSAATYLYVDWLPKSNEEIRDFPLFVQRISFFPDVPEHEPITDLYLPLK